MRSLTERAQSRATLLIETSALPVSQAATPQANAAVANLS